MIFNTKREMKFDDFLNAIGEFGRYQRRLYVMLSLPAVHNGLIMILLVVFLFVAPDHRCAIPGLPNDTYRVQDEKHAELINLTIPMVSDSQGDLEYSKCHIYSDFNNSIFTNRTEKCDSWVYSKELFTSTISESMNFVCERKAYQTHAKMFGMIGHLIGVLISGPLSDLFGRRTVILAGMFTAVMTSICLTWIPNFNILIPVVILIAGGYNTMYLACFIYNMEIIGPSKRMFTGVAMNFFWSAGNMIVALAAFLLRDWQIRQLVLAVPGILFLYLFFLPESPRWLLSQGRRNEALKVLRKMADTNNVDIPPRDLDTIDALDDTRKEPFWHLLQSSVLRKRLLIICYNWFAIGMGFYGLSMNVTNLSGNIYLNFFLFALVELCAYVICIIVINRVGRKVMLCTAMLSAGVTCVLTFVPFMVSDHPSTWIVNTLACMGNTCVSAGFAVVYVFSAELLPTTSRNFGMGLCSLICRVGSLLSPYINDLTLHVTGKYSQIIPMLIFGGVTGLAGLLTLLLPETHNLKLPENIEEAEKLGSKLYFDLYPDEASEDKKDALLMKTIKT